MNIVIDSSSRVVCCLHPIRVGKQFYSICASLESWMNEYLHTIFHPSTFSRYWMDSLFFSSSVPLCSNGSDATFNFRHFLNYIENSRSGYFRMYVHCALCIPFISLIISFFHEQRAFMSSNITVIN